MIRTTDNQDELFDHVNENDEVIGQITRRNAHANTHHIHRSVSIMVFNKKDELFMQKRSMTKDTDPGYWGTSVGGHVESGEDYKQAALKEFKEELGVFSDIMFLKKFIVRLPTETEVNVVYKANHEGPFELHPQEIEGGKFWDLNELEQAIIDNYITVNHCSLVSLHLLLGLIPQKKNLQKDIIKIFSSDI